MISTMEEDPKNLGSLNEHWNLSQLLACKEGKYNPRSYMHTTPCPKKQCAFFPGLSAPSFSHTNLQGGTATTCLDARSTWSHSRPIDLGG